jgi:hypothetical protein
VRRRRRGGGGRRGPVQRVPPDVEAGAGEERAPEAVLTDPSSLPDKCMHELVTIACQLRARGDHRRVNIGEKVV